MTASHFIPLQPYQSAARSICGEIADPKDHQAEPTCLECRQALLEDEAACSMMLAKDTDKKTEVHVWFGTVTFRGVADVFEGGTLTIGDEVTGAEIKSFPAGQWRSALTSDAQGYPLHQWLPTVDAVEAVRR